MNINNVNINLKGITFRSSKNILVTSPINSSEKSENNVKINYTPNININVPLKYSNIGVLELPCDLKAHLYKLENGQRVVVIPKTGPTVLKTYVNTGSMNETDEQRGISHFIEHSLFNGSEGLKEGEFFKTVNKIGGNTNAATGFSSTNYYISSNLLKSTDLEEEIKIHASMLETPRFTNEMIEKEKGPVISEISMITDNSNNLAVNNSIKNLFNINTTSKDMIGGTIDNINNLTREKIVKYYNDNYYPANMVTVITGEVNPNDTIKLISKYFHSKAKKQINQYSEKLVPITKTVRNDIVTPKATKTHICLAFAGPQNNNSKDKILYEAFSTLMFGRKNARLTNALEKIQSEAASSTDRIGTKPSDKSVIIIDSVTSEHMCEKVLETIYSEIQDIISNPPGKNELDIVKNQLKLSMSEIFEYSSDLNSLIGNALLDNDIESVSNYFNIVDDITSQDIVDFVQKYIDLNKVSITAVHPQKAVKGSFANSQNISFGSSSSTNKYQVVNADNINKYVLNNNIELYINNINKELSVAELSISTDSIKNIKPGTAELLSLMLNQGSKLNDKESFYNNLDNKGINFSVLANDTTISVYTKCLPKDINNAIDSMKEVVMSPLLTEENYKEAKAQLKESLETITPTSSSALISELYKGQRHSIQAKDIKQNLDNISLKDIIELYKHIMSNSQALCVISGPTTDENFTNTVLTNLNYDFKTFKPAKLINVKSYKPVVKTRVILQSHEKSQAQIELGYKFKTNDNIKDSVTFVLLNTILGGTASSRLFNDLREKQKLAYHVASRIYSYDNSDVISLFIKTTTDDKSKNESLYDNLQKSIDGFNKHINLLKTELVTEEELENAKKVFKNKILNSNESTANKNSLIIDSLNSAYGIELNNKALDIADTITAEDIKNAANYIFKTNPILSIVATDDTLNYNKNYLNNIGENVYM